MRGLDGPISTSIWASVARLFLKNLATGTPPSSTT
jgi:hypothetical protein